MGAEGESRWITAGLVAGILFVALQLGAFGYFVTSVFPRFAPIAAPAVERATAVAKLGGTLRLGNYLLAFPAPFFLVLLGGLFGVVRRLPKGGDAAAIVVVAAGAAMALMWPLGGIISDIELDLALAGGDPATVSSLDAIAPYTLALSAFGRAVFMGAASLALFGLPGAARWTAGSGLVIAALSLIGTATLVVAAAFPVLALSSLLFDVWLLALCIVLLRMRRAAALRVA